MPKVSLAHQTAVNPRLLLDSVHRQFEGKYKVYRSRWVAGETIIVEKNPWVGVLVRVSRKKIASEIRFGGTVPNPLVMAVSVLATGWLLYLLIFLLVLRPRWKRMEGEVNAFLRDAPEIQRWRTAAVPETQVT